MIFYPSFCVVSSFKSLRSTGPYRGQSCARPPSTASFAGVMKLLSDDARKALPLRSPRIGHALSGVIAGVDLLALHA